MSRTMWASSVASLRTNLRRAGTLKKRSRTSTVVPCGCAAGRTGLTWPPSTLISAPACASCARVAIRRRDTEPIEGSASPRNPSVVTVSRSSSEPILLVACRASASGSSAAATPRPSSRTRTSPTPPRSTSTSMRCATRIERVLHQLLDHGGGALDDLAGGDLIDELVGEDTNGHADRESVQTIRPARGTRAVSFRADRALRPPRRHRGGLRARRPKPPARHSPGGAPA